LAGKTVLIINCNYETIFDPSPVATNESGSSTDKEELSQKFALLRPEVLETLRKLSFLCFATSNHCKQEGPGTLKPPFRWPRNTEISAVLQHSAIEILTILQKKILTSAEYKAIWLVSSMSLRKSCTSGTSNMVRNHL